MNVNLAYYSFADNKFYEPLDVLNADITIFKAVSSAMNTRYTKVVFTFVPHQN